VQAIFHVTEGQVIAVDGKTLRGAYERGQGRSMIHMVSAWATANRIVLGQCKTQEKSNEITAIPELLKLLDLAGAVVTIDAMGTQKAIAQQIVDQDGDYVLALKGNQGNLHQDVMQFSVQDKRLQKAFRKGFHENYDIRFMKPYEPGYTITKCTATPPILARSQIKLFSRLPHRFVAS
jgi:predicted transposase YbfD/YdcC